MLRVTLSKILIFRFHPELELADNFGFVEKCGSDSYFIVWFVTNIPWHVRWKYGRASQMSKGSSVTFGPDTGLRPNVLTFSKTMDGIFH